jgi:hypothetical protein
MRSLLGCFVFGAVFAACGGASSSLLDNDNDDAGASRDGGSKRDGSAAGDAGCINPVFGGSCTPDESVCGQVGTGNPCCDAAWRCIDGKWQSLAAECACLIASTACGDKTCKPGQYCQVQPPGIALEDGGTPPTDYECMDPPSSCSSGATCAFLEAAPPCSISSCDDSSSGIVTLDCIGE